MKEKLLKFAITMVVATQSAFLLAQDYSGHRVSEGDDDGGELGPVGGVLLCIGLFVVSLLCILFGKADPESKKQEGCTFATMGYVGIVASVFFGIKACS